MCAGSKVDKEPSDSHFNLILCFKIIYVFRTLHLFLVLGSVLWDAPIQPKFFAGPASKKGAMSTLVKHMRTDHARIKNDVSGY